MSDSLSKQQIGLLANLLAWLNAPPSNGVFEERSFPYLPENLPRAELRVLLGTATKAGLLRYDQNVPHPQLPHDENRPLGPYWAFTQKGVDRVQSARNEDAALGFGQNISAFDSIVRNDHGSDSWQPIQADLTSDSSKEVIASIQAALNSVESDNGFAVNSPRERSTIVYSLKVGIELLRTHLPSREQIAVLVLSPLKYVMRVFGQHATAELAKKAFEKVMSWLSGL